MLRSTSQLGSEARVTTDTTHMDTTIRTAIPTDRIGTLAIIGLIMGTAGIAITATIGITPTATGTIDNRVT